MDKQQLIESGILELYVLGELSQSECNQIQHLLDDDDVKQELQKIELNLEQIGRQEAIAPPVGVKRNIMEHLVSSAENVNDKSSAHKIHTSKNANSLTHQILRWKRNFQVAAVFAGLMSLAFGWQLYKGINKDKIQSQLLEMQGQVEQLSASNTVITDQMAYINHTYTTPIVLKGNVNAPESKAVVYWNPTVSEALLSTNGLPELPKGKEYQIWADIDGEMISMKVFNLKQKLIKLPYMADAESLNVTIEPKGGSDHPTIEQLLVNAPTTPSVEI